MTTEPESLVLKHLRAIPGGIGKPAEEMATVRVEMTAMHQHMTAITTIQQLDLADIADIKVRLDRIEKRLVH
jgi:hypothetical protein